MSFMTEQLEWFRRVFVAIPLPEAVRRSLAAERKRLEPVGADVGWVEPVDYHLTLAFIGDLECVRAWALGCALEQALGNFEVFSFGVVGLGYFESRGRPRVLWAGVEDSREALLALHGHVRRVLQELGIAVERRAFAPHITLGRIRDIKRVDALTQQVELRKSARYGVVEADRVEVMARAEGSSRSRYQSLHVVRLKGASNGGENGCQ